ncbi:MAG: hypothetical protein K2F77_02225 [Muribaculaceae bacterium]|nr:hypothetical protein [Muribaculaceae bacterium]
MRIIAALIIALIAWPGAEARYRNIAKGAMAAQGIKGVENVRRQIAKTIDNSIISTPRNIPAGNRQTVGQRNFVLHRSQPIDFNYMEKLKEIKAVEFQDIQADMKNMNKAFYNIIKAQVESGALDYSPQTLLRVACIAVREADDDLAALCLEKARTDQLQPSHLADSTLNLRTLKAAWPDMVQYVAERNLARRFSMPDTAPDSMPAERIEERNTMLSLASKYRPALTPLVEAAYLPRLATQPWVFTHAMDSLLSGAVDYTPATKQLLAAAFITVNYNVGLFSTVLEYFEEEPLKQMADTTAPILLDLASGAMCCRSGEVFYDYILRADALDHELTQQHLEILLATLCDMLLDDPSDESCAEWAIFLTDSPVEAAIELICHLSVMYFPDYHDWTWRDITTYTPEQTAAYRCQIYLARKGFEQDTGQSTKASRLTLENLLALLLSYDSATKTEAETIMHRLHDTLAADSDPALQDVRLLAAICSAHIDGRGLDHPKLAFKVLKKNEALAAAPETDPQVAADYYSYMAAVCALLKKKKDAARYQAMSEAAASKSE